MPPESPGHEKDASALPLLTPNPPEGVTEIAAPRPPEISGVAAVTGGYAVVGDETSTHGYIWPRGRKFSFRRKIRDAESIAVGHSRKAQIWLILGENRARLADLDGGLFDFPPMFLPRAGRGLEGLAIFPYP